ncbi:hypothetical protein T05_3665, partial [Trichinella murrelli]
LSSFHSVKPIHLNKWLDFYHPPKLLLNHRQ